MRRYREEVKGERNYERQLFFQCHSRPPSGVFRPLKPPLFQRPLTLLSPFTPPLPSIVSLLHISPSPSCLNSSTAEFSLLHPRPTFILLSVFLPSFCSFLCFPLPSLLFCSRRLSDLRILFSTPLLLPTFPPTLKPLFINWLTVRERGVRGERQAEWKEVRELFRAGVQKQSCATNFSCWICNSRSYPVTLHRVMLHFRHAAAVVCRKTCFF